MAVTINIASQVSQTINNGVTNKAPSEDAVFDALALKVNTTSPDTYGVITNDNNRIRLRRTDGALYDSVIETTAAKADVYYIDNTGEGWHRVDGNVSQVYHTSLIELIAPITIAYNSFQLSEMKALSSGGVSIKSNSGTAVAEFGAGGGGNWTFEDGVKLNAGTALRILATDANKNIQYLDTATYPTLTELSYVKGVTGSIQPQITPTAATGTVIDFTNPKEFNSVASPATGNITDDLTGAKAGVIQKIYHNHSSAPTVPAGWVLVGAGTYATSTLNIIFAVWVSGSRVEYWITQ